MRAFLHSGICFLVGVVWLITLQPATAMAESNQHDAPLAALFEQLAKAADYEKAQGIEQRIWASWQTAGDERTDQLLEMGTQAMISGRLGLALKAFTRAIEHQPEVAEGWNKRATVYYILHKFDQSAADVAEVLKREPRHFGALTGLAKIRSAQGKEEEALNLMERALNIHPTLPGLRDGVEILRERVYGKPI